MAQEVVSRPSTSRAEPAGACAGVVSFSEAGARCVSSCARGQCLALDLDAEGLRLLDAIFGNPARVKKREALFRAGEPFAALYAVRLGTFKTVMLSEDGREQIAGYHMGGDILGLDGIGDERHACEAIALEDSEVCALSFAKLDELARRDPLVRRNLFRLISRDLCRGQEMMLLLGSRRADERLAAFLVNLAGRFRSRGYSANEFALRMTREEIASYLGLKLETVSRLFSRLHAEGLIQVQGRSIKLLDPVGLNAMAGQTSLSQTH
jgi:CRP/FNR family transcriptional regulator